MGPHHWLFIIWATGACALIASSLLGGFGIFRLRQSGQRLSNGTRQNLDAVCRALEPPLWKTSTHLSEGQGFTQARALLEEFERSDLSEIDGLKRSLMQHDLWAVADRLHMVADQNGKSNFRSSRLVQAWPLFGN